MKRIFTLLSLFSVMGAVQAQDSKQTPEIQIFIDAETVSGTDHSWDARYRSTKTPFAKPELALNTHGMDSLRAAACMQFSESDFANLLTSGGY